MAVDNVAIAFSCRRDLDMAHTIDQGIGGALLVVWVVGNVVWLLLPIILRHDALRVMKRVRVYNETTCEVVPSTVKSSRSCCKSEIDRRFITTDFCDVRREASNLGGWRFLGSALQKLPTSKNRRALISLLVERASEFFVTHVMAMFFGSYNAPLLVLLDAFSRYRQASRRPPRNSHHVNRVVLFGGAPSSKSATLDPFRHLRDTGSSTYGSDSSDSSVLRGGRHSESGRRRPARGARDRSFASCWPRNSLGPDERWDCCIRLC
jgi:hypothetical protein